MQSTHDDNKTAVLGQELKFDPHLFPGVERRQLFRIWQQFPQGKTLVELGAVIGMTGTGLSRILDGERMPEKYYEPLLKAGVPEFLLPQPKDVKPGPKPKQ